MKSCKTIEKIRRAGKAYMMVMATGLLCFLSCNETFDRVLVEDYGDSDTNYPQGKVLLIMLDGVAGKAVQQAVNASQAPEIKRLLDNAMYTFEGLADAKSNTANISGDRGWANLLTGVTNHGIGDSKENLSELTTPTFLARIKEGSKTVTTDLFSGNEEVVDALANDVDGKELLVNDEAVTQALVSRLSDHQAAMPDMLIGQLEGVQLSGLANGFYEESGAVKSHIITAIHTIDAQIGQIMDALKNRPNYAKENWLVVITSNYGGMYEGDYEGTFYEDVRRNTFTLLHSHRLSSTLLQPKGAEIKYNFFSPWYSGNGGTDRAVVKDANLFNMGGRLTDQKSYTIQFMIYDTWTSAGDSHTILSKRPRINNGAGWNIRMNASGGNVAVRLEGNSGSPGDHWYQIRKNNPWRVYTYVYKECGTTDSLIRYMDGVEYGRSALNNNEMSNDAPLTIGKIEGSNVGVNGHFFINNLQFYDVALPPAYLATNYCKTGLDKIEGFPYWDNLIGYWPNDREQDYGEGILRDYSKYGSVYGGENAGRSDMVLEGAKWEARSMLDPNVCPDPDASFYREVFNTVDIPFQIMFWFGISADRQWNLEGVGWPFQYKVLTN